MLEVIFDVIAVMFGISGIVFAIGEILNDEKIKSASKNMVIENFFNVGIIGLCLALFTQNGIITSLINSMFSGITIDCAQNDFRYNYALCFAYNFLIGKGYILNGLYYEPLILDVSSLISLLLGVNALISSFGALPVVGYAIINAFNPVEKLISNAVGSLSWILISISAQGVFIKALARYGVSLLLPLSLLLKSFWPTKKLGATMLAFFISFVFLFPLTYLSTLLIEGVNIPKDENVVASINNGFEGLKNSIGNRTQNATLNYTPMNMWPSSSVFDAISQWISAVFEYIGYIAIKVTVLPMLSILVSIIFAKELGEVLGGGLDYKVKLP